MPSLFDLGALQAPSASPPPRWQEWYERQQTSSRSTNLLAGPMGTQRIGGDHFSQSHPYEQALPGREIALELRSLQQCYMILESDDLIIETLGEEPALYALLSEAVRPLQDAFGEGRILQVRAKISDEDRLLKVAVQLPVDFDEPERALRRFDTDWWLNNCQRSGGTLVFDYEIQDAV